MYRVLYATHKRAHALGCGSKITGIIQTPKKGAWEDEVIEAIGALYASRSTLQRPGKPSLWDLFDLDPHNGG
jgi:hypothetical protein